MNEIVQEIPLSKGTIYNIIHDWRSQITGTNIEEIRAFMSEVRKSDMTIEECAQGFRIIQLLKKFDIHDEFDVGVNKDDELEDLGPNKENLDFKTGQNPSTLYANKAANPNDYANTKNRRLETNKIAYFLEHIYKNCKKHDITPNTVIGWIDDLLNSFHDFVTESDQDFDYNDTTSSDINNSVEKKKNEQGIRKELPFVSRLSFYIKRGEKKIQHLENIKSSISKEIDDLTKQRQDLISRVNKTIEIEKKVFSYLKWYENLKKELFYNHSLLIEQEFGPFANAIDDFKQYNFDVTKILTEYRHVNSLRIDIDLIQKQVDTNKATRDALVTEVAWLEEQKNYSRQTINTLNEFQKIGIGLKELKQLSNTIMESAFSNNFSVRDSVKKFFIDLDKDYDNKLGFEKKVEELKSQVKDIENQIPNYKQFLEFHIGAVSSLNHLNSNGVTNPDIISMNHLVSIFSKNDFLSDPLDQNTDKPSEKNIDPNKPNKTTYWQQFIAKLQHLRNINQEINKQMSKLNILNEQIDTLDKNKQQLEKAYTDAVSNLHTILSKINQSLDAVSQIDEDIDKRKIVSVPIVFPVFIKSNYFIINKKLDEKKEDKTDQ